jgi:signal transduction histidine kinase
MKPRINSIHRQVLLFAFFICLAVLLPVGGALLANHISQFRAKLSQSFQATSQVIATNASAALAFNDKPAATELLASLIHDPSIASAALYDKDNVRFVTYGETPLSPPDVRLNDGFSADLVDVSYKGEPYGHLLLISRYPAELRRAILVWVSVYAAGILLASVLAFFLAARFHRAVATPLQLLAETAGDVTASKNYGVRVSLDGPTEIRELAQAFNTMLEEIGRRDAELAEKSETLAHQLTVVRKEVHDREVAEQLLRENNREMMRLSREAGMAEVATGVLHNIGNALNSINVSTELLFIHVRDQARETATTLRDFLIAPPANAAAVFSSHPVGTSVKNFAASLARLTVAQMDEAAGELASLRTGVDHLKDIVSRQQSLAKTATVIEPFDLREAVQDALLLSKSDVQGVDLHVEAMGEGPFNACADRSSVVQILINLISNARAAMDDGQVPIKILRIQIGPVSGDNVSVAVIDNGCGIASHQLVSIFSYGFTTKKEGHGFGLHNAANAARIMGGSLHVHSGGPGQGAAFTLNLPRHASSSS